MAIYAIGDVQGCYTSLQKLLATVNFDSSLDRLWFTGDLVNRGPDSLEVLRFVKSLATSAVTVLGNHDLHLLAMTYGVRAPGRRDTLNPVLTAPDRDELIQWLRHRPLIYSDNKLKMTLVHAGLLPQWDITEASSLASEVEQALRSDALPAFLENMYGDQPTSWETSLSGWDRIRVITNALTRLRFCDSRGNMDLESKGPPGTQRPGYVPWFEAENRRSLAHILIFGHWATLPVGQYHRAIALDGGCLWGGKLTAVRLDCDSPEFTQIPCPISQTP